MVRTLSRSHCWVLYFFLLVNCLATATTSAWAEILAMTGVQIEGNQRIDRAAIRAQLKSVVPGVTITSALVSEDVKALYKTGFFDQVTAAVVTVEGRPMLRFRLVEKPLVRRVFIKGNEAIDQSDLSKAFSFDARRFFDRTKIAGMMRQGEVLYQNRGYFDAAFQFSVVPVGENQVDVTFTVSEGPRYKIRRISFRGVETLDPDELRAQVQTKRYKWWNSWLLGTGRLNNDLIENDKLMIKQYFLDQGLLDATVSDPIVEKRDGDLFLSFQIHEGKKYSIGKISASGDLIESSVAATLEGVSTTAGEPFNATAVREDSFKISERLSDQGFAFANVVPNTSLDRDAGLVDIEFAVSRGKLTTVNHINIRGNDKTYDNVIRREMRVDEQDQFSGSKVKRSQAILQRLGFFEEVNIAQEPVGEDKVDLNVNVREGSTGTFSAGAGYSSSDGALFNTRLSENNLLGTGRRAVLNLDFGTQRQSQVISLDDRRLFDSYVSGGFDLLRTTREFSDFDRRLAGGSLTLGYPLEQVFEGEWAEDVSASLKYEYLDIEISNVDREDAAQLVIDSEGKSRASSVTPRLIRNTINNPLNPTEGSRQQISFEYAGSLGGNQDFYLVEVENSLYYPILKTSFGDLTFSWRTQFGYGDSGDGDPFPLYRRFFPGGINSVRGFKNRTLGPKDSRDNEFGGSKQLINNFEMIFPCSAQRASGGCFYDAGEAFDDNKSIDFADLRQAYGFGVRWNSPLGPLRIEFGFPVDREDGEDSMVTQFSFGAPL